MMSFISIEVDYDDGDFYEVNRSIRIPPGMQFICYELEAAEEARRRRHEEDIEKYWHETDHLS